MRARAVVARFPVEWSFSRRSVAEQCPRRYYYHYYGSSQRYAKGEPLKVELRRLKATSNRHLLCGKLLHVVIRTLIKRSKQGEAWSAERTIPWARRMFEESVTHSRECVARRGLSGDCAEAGSRSVAHLREFARYQEDDAARLCADAAQQLVTAIENLFGQPALWAVVDAAARDEAIMEKPVRVATSDFRARGQVDLAYYSDGRYTIIDWKAGALGDASDSLQLLFYALWAHKIERVPVALLDINRIPLGDAKVVPYRVDERALHAAEARICQDLEKLSSLHQYGVGGVREAFTPCSQPRVCQLCEYMEICGGGA